MQAESKPSVNYRAIVLYSRVINSSAKGYERRLCCLFASKHLPCQIQPNHWFPCLGNRLHPRSLSGVQTSCPMKILATSTYTDNGQSILGNAWELFIMLSSICLSLLLQTWRSYSSPLLWELVPYHQHSSYCYGDMFISLWDLYRPGGLSFDGRIYDKTTRSVQVFNHWDK